MIDCINRNYIGKTQLYTGNRDRIRDSQLYHLSRQRIRLLNGQVEYAYRYTISNAYKARLSRAPYYDGTLQPRSW